jgi:CRISPR system Cascade subunit CasD
MSTLLLRMAGPMQSWGIDAKFERRTTGREPSRSGVMGLCAAAMGIRRDADAQMRAISAALRFGVRVDKPGSLLCDFHTALKDKFPYVTYRYYLADAAFLVGLEGEDALIESLEAALRAPAFPLFLGRRCCPPEGKLVLGIRETDLETALREESLLCESMRAEDLRLVLDAGEQHSGYLLRDQPLSFNSIHRKFSFRRVHEETLKLQAKVHGETDQDAWTTAEEVKG